MDMPVYKMVAYNYNPLKNARDCMIKQIVSFWSFQPEKLFQLKRWIDLENTQLFTRIYSTRKPWLVKF